MEYKGLVRRQKEFFRTGKTRKPGFRIFYLGKLLRWMDENEERILEAVKKDLGDSGAEEYQNGIRMLRQEIQVTIRHLPLWMRPRKVPAHVSELSSVSYIGREPYGSVLVLTPWNDPFHLAVAPLIGAVGAGNCVVLTTSSYTVHTSSLIRNMIREVFPSCYVSAVTGDQEEREALLQETFDYVLFTGSPKAEHSREEQTSRGLSPVNLELNGKSPCIVDETADLRAAARRIVWNKFVHAGQTCAAPDYVLVQHSVRKRLVQYMMKQIQKMYGPKPLENESYPSIINQRHFNRICGLINERKVVYGGESDPDALRIEPTIMEGVTWDDAVMKEEIFGPVLPVMSYYDLSEAADAVEAQSGVLAVYLFAKDKKREREILSELTLHGEANSRRYVQLALPLENRNARPYGRMSKYYGRAGFDLFSCEKKLSKRSALVENTFDTVFQNQLNRIKRWI